MSLASFTPSGEAENEARVASFGTPFTRTRWAGVALVMALVGLVTSGQEWQTFNFRSFPLIPLVDGGWGFTLILAFSPQGRRDLTAFAGAMGST